jgi:hypothetical protein
MRVRLKKDKTVTGHASRFNTHGLSEIIVGFDGGDMDSCYISDYEVLIKGKGWIDMSLAFQNRDLIPNNFNTDFGVPRNDEERQRGWYD